MQITIDDIRKEASKFDLSEEETKIAVILLSSLVVGANIQRIQEFTGYDREFISGVARKLRKSGIWRKDKVDGEEWFDKKNGGVAFLCDVLVGLGYAKRVYK